MIQEAFSDDVIQRPLKVDGPALQGAQEWNPTLLKGHVRVGRSGGGRPLADLDDSRSRTGATPFPLVRMPPPRG